MAKVKEFGHLSLEQQSKLMQEIGALSKVEGDDGARARAKELIDFLYSLERHCYITQAARVRYLDGIQDAMGRRRKEAK